jgi:hypothetical protein
VSKDISVWLSVFCILSIYSFLYKENPVFRFAEHMYVGLAGGYAIAVSFDNIRTMALIPISQGQYMLILPCILGCFLFARLSTKYSWLARYPVAIMVGIGTGLSLRGIPSSQILAQIRATLMPLTSINNILLVFGTVGTLVYFLFTKEHRGTVGIMAGVGKQFMMVSFGVIFAATIFDNISMLVGTFYKIFYSWLGFGPM